jgi:hypothetical protein
LAVTLLRVSEAAAGPLQVRVSGAPAGVVAAPAQAAADAKSVALVLKAGPTPVTAPIVVEAVAASGKVLGRSAPFLLDVKSDDNAGR